MHAELTALKDEPEGAAHGEAEERSDFHLYNKPTGYTAIPVLKPSVPGCGNKDGLEPV
jgi:hypothetical protein